MNHAKNDSIRRISDGAPTGQPPSSNLLPFLKWAGGKRWLTDGHPHLLNVTFRNYFEPFLGSGAVFFHIAPQSGTLSDSNEDLINTYRAIRDDWISVVRHLRKHQRNHDSRYYYAVRSQVPRSPATKAAQFIYLNRTCWNGLYRVNLRGQFNVPVGTKTKVLLNSDSFQSVARLLAPLELATCDFGVAIDRAERDDFVFVDPPYTIQHNHNGFIKYNESLFSWDDQVRLRDAVERACLRGVKLLITNAYHRSVKKLYQGLGEQLCLRRSSVIAGTNAARGHYDELVIKCF